MINKNFDGIKKLKVQPQVKSVVKKPQILKMDGIVRRPLVKVVTKPKKFKPIYIAPVKHASRRSSFFANKFIFVKNIYSNQKVPVLAAVLALFIAFGFGAWFALNTSHSAADDNSGSAVLGEQTQTPAGSVVLPGIGAPTGTSANDNSVLFNTPIEYLKNYFDSINQPDVINSRKNQLSQFLKDMHSPLVPTAETIAEQPHWQLILAISFAESTLGKNCNDFNCSNIGVGPTSPYWHKYNSYQDWVIDFNRLLDKKYNNWTLKQMCGVYVKPCNPNWLSATQQILDALKDRGIE
jgi:hypothetical protein